MATILVVDDRPLNREFLVTLLGYAGHTVLEAGDGADALYIAHTRLPDLVISDVLMPRMDGVELARRMQGDPVVGRIPMIFYTATYRLSEAYKLAESCGVAHVLPKPSKPRAILSLVAQVLGSDPTPEMTAEAPPVPGMLGGAVSSHSDVTGLQKQWISPSAGERLPGADSEALPGFGLRVLALLELGLELSSLREPSRLLSMFSRAAQDIMSTRHAAAALLDTDGTLRFLSTQGLPEEVTIDFRSGSSAPGVLNRVLVEGRAFHAPPQVSPTDLGLPASHPFFDDLLALPIRSATRNYGWVYFAGRLGEDRFTEADEQIGMTLATQLALTYENLSLYEASQQYAVRLEQEIAGRQQAQQTLDERQTQYRKVVDMSADALFVMQDGQFVLLNPAALHLFGAASESQVLGRDVFDFIHPDFRPVIRQRVATALQQDAPLPMMEQKLLRVDCSVVEVEACSTRFSFEGREALLVNARDITRRKRAEEMRALLAAIVESSDDAIYACDLDGRITSWNPGAERLYGYTAQEALGQPISMLAPPERQDEVELIQARLRAGEEDRSERHRIRKDGCRIDVSLTVSPLRDGAGQVIGMSRIARDVSEAKRAADALRESETRFRQLAENLREVFFLVDPATGRQLYVSPATKDIWGLTPEAMYEDPMAWAEAILPEDGAVLQAMLDARNGTGSFDCEYRIRNTDGQVRWIWARGFPIHDEQGQVYRVAGIAEDITERKEQQTKIARLNRIHAVLSGIDSTIVRVRDRQGLMNAACRIAVEEGGFGMAWIGLVDRDTQQIVPAAASNVPQDSLARLRLSAREDLPEGLGVAGEAMRTGRAVICNDMRTAAHVGVLRGEALAEGYRSVAALPLLQDGQGIGVLVLYARDVDYFDDEELVLLDELATDTAFGLQYIEREERVQFLANYDPLTGLPNAALFRDRLAQFVIGARYEGRSLAVMLLDIDRFKDLNDTLGRHVGDSLLQLVAGRLRHAVLEPCCVARVGGDTFAVAAANLPPGADATTILRDRIFEPFAHPFTLGGSEVPMSARVGVALYPGDGDEAETLYRNAEAALVQAKAQDEEFLYYAPALNARVAEKLALEHELRTALESNQLHMYYQPRVDLRSGRIIGAEALIRWQHPQRGLLLPGQFIPLAEETGLIVPIGDWVIRTVCAQLATWHAHSPVVVPVALNLSAVQFRKGQVHEVLRRALEEFDLPPDLVELEITESVVMRDVDTAARVLKSFRQLGVRLALDDFGTGYSSLAYLKRFPFDCVKIDRAFVTDITRDAEDAGIVAAIVAMAGSLRLQTVAEGVETAGQLTYLHSLGCDQIQGFLFSKAVPAEEFDAMLRAGRSLPVPQDEGAAERTLLLVDDDEQVLSSLKRALAAEGYRILSARRGEEALDVLATHRVQVVVSDERMPGMSGSELLSAVKALYPETVRIILSGYADLRTVVDAVNQGSVYKFLTKPWKDEHLRENVRDAFLRYRGPGGERV